MPSDHEEKMIGLTHQMRHNQADLQKFISDLDSWETDIKKKEEALLSKKPEPSNQKESLPPVRNTIHKKKLKKKKKQKSVNPENQKNKISGFDFRAWDKFDVDKALEEIEQEPKKEETSSSEYETDEEWEMERRLHLAGKEKEKGNAFLKKGEYDQAVEAYSRGMEYDSSNALLPANRAMALLKQQKFAAAELDCTSALALDPLYVKAYLRRATARVNLTKTKEAIEDYNRVLDLEPTNKMAKTEIERLQKEKERNEKDVIPSSLTDGDKAYVKAIYKPPEERSKAPLRRIVIEEIGIEKSKRTQQPLTEQSLLTKQITERESQNFDNLLANSHVTKSEIMSSPNTKPIIQEIHLASGDSTEIESSIKDGQRNNENIEDQAKATEKTKTDAQSIEGLCEGKKRDNSFTKEEDKAIPSIPKSSFQFQTDFRILKNRLEDFHKYFIVIPVSHYPNLFGQCLDADILKTIIKALLEFGIGLNAYDILTGLTHVKRFSMTAMFLSRQEKQSARELMDKISTAKLCSSDELSSLKKKYDL